MEMKIKSTYMKMKDGRIQAKLSCIDAGEYGDKCIFPPFVCKVEEVEERMKQRLYQKVEKASKLVLKIGKENWVKAIRESREER